MATRSHWKTVWRMERRPRHRSPTYDIKWHGASHGVWVARRLDRAEQGHVFALLSDAKAWADAQPQD
jgi:hypothetical protein